MAELVIVYWRDIPAQVKSGSGRQTVRKELSPRFAEAIDRAAMRCGAKDSDTYLSYWRTSDPRKADGDVAKAVDELASRLETEWTDARISAAVANGGLDAG